MTGDYHLVWQDFTDHAVGDPPPAACYMTFTRLDTAQDEMARLRSMRPEIAAAILPADRDAARRPAQGALL